MKQCPPSEKKNYRTENNPGEAIFTRTQKHYHYNVARLTIPKTKQVFEIDIEPQRALEFRHGKDIDIRDVLKVQRIFHDVSKAEFAKNTELKEFFDTEDPLEVAKVILQKGEIQPTIDELARLHEEKKKRIFDVLIKYAVTAKTRKPINAEHLESIIHQGKVKMDIHEPDSWLIRKIVEAAKSIMPLDFDVHKIQVTLAPQFIEQARYHMKTLTKIVSEEMLPDGSWQVTAEVPVGIKEELFNYLNALTHGKFSSKLVRG
ncbi:ribosome assembly factor SBDS [Candidatus Woesearchaeota archaeon]|nr:ribosome assembly factor SBDS [Candidatus Woesearchaeota archaeon]